MSTVSILDEQTLCVWEEDVTECEVLLGEGESGVRDCLRKVRSFEGNLIKMMILTVSECRLVEVDR